MLHKMDEPTSRATHRFLLITLARGRELVIEPALHVYPRRGGTNFKAPSATQFCQKERPTRLREFR